MNEQLILGLEGDLSILTAFYREWLHSTVLFIVLSNILNLVHYYLLEKPKIQYIAITIEHFLGNVSFFS